MKVLPVSTLLVFGIMACSGPTDTNHIGLSLRIVGGNAQTDTVMQVLPGMLEVQVLSGDQPVPGIVVNYAASDGCGEPFTPAVSTNDSGRTRNQWTLGPTAGPCEMEARAIDPAGQPVVLGTFTATALHDKLTRWSFHNTQSIRRFSLNDLTPIDARVFIKAGIDQWGNAIPTTEAIATEMLNWSMYDRGSSGIGCLEGLGTGPAGVGWDVPIPDFLTLGYRVGRTIMNNGVRDTTVHWVAPGLRGHNPDGSGSVLIAMLTLWVDGVGRCGL